MQSAKGVAVLALIAAAAAGRCTPSPEAPLRVVLVTLDTLRFDALRGGPDRPSQMPRLVDWARRGMVFERYYSAAPQTQPTHASLLTGLHPWQTGVPRNGMVLADRQVTLTERMRDAGFRTGAVVGSFVLNRQFGLDQGFERYLDRSERPGGKRAGRRRKLSYRRDAEQVTQAALTLVGKTRGDRQFFWFHYFDAHSPYGLSVGEENPPTPKTVLAHIAAGDDPRPLLTRARSLYDRDVRYLDEALDRLLRQLLDAPGSERTHVVVVADHGESFGEAGSVGHSYRLTPEQIHVPCIVISPRVAPGISSEPVGTIDLTTTILSLAGVAETGLGGRDLLDPGAGTSPVVGMRRTFAAPYEDLRTDGRVHVLEQPRFYVVDGPDLLTGRRDEVPTRNDSAEPVTGAEKIAAIQALFGGFEAQLEEVPLHERTEDETLERLEALGYVR